MSKDLFTHFEPTLNGRRAAPPAPDAIPEPSPDAASPEFPSPVVAPTAAEPDVFEQISKLAVLRDQGILSEDEFAANKAELLARL